MNLIFHLKVIVYFLSCARVNCQTAQYRTISISTALVVFLAFLSMSCAKRPEPRSASNVRYVLLGDPLNLIAGATKNQSVDPNFFDSENLYLYSSLVFVNFAAYAPSAPRDLINENAARPRSTTVVRLTVALSPDRVTLMDEFGRRAMEIFVNSSRAEQFSDSAQTEPLSVISGPSNQTPNANQTNKASSSEPSIAVIYSDRQAPRRMIVEHFSVAPDENNMSLMLSHQEGALQSLFVFYFAKDFQPRRPRVLNVPYTYLLGEGVQVRWPTPNVRPLDVCGRMAQPLIPKVEYATTLWQQALGPRATLTVRYVPEFRPFSDLNQSCVYIVDNYLREGDTQLVNFGITIPVVDWNSQQILDADVLLFNREFKKYGDSIFDPDLAPMLDYTLVHEIGHWLGLHHQFNGVPSVMSYDHADFAPTFYDRRAIQRLYDD